MTQTIDWIAADYNATLRHEYETIRKQTKAGTLPLNERIEACERASSAYVIAQDEEWERKRQRAIDEGRSVNTVPIQYRDAGALERLADVLMDEYLTWDHHDKMNVVENPILSRTQTLLRHRKESPLEDVYTGKNDATIGRKRGSGGEKHRVYDYMTPERDMSLIPSEHLDLYGALDGAGLTGRQRQAIELVYFEGLTQADAAERMGVGQDVISRRLSASVGKISEYMAKYSE